MLPDGGAEMDIQITPAKLYGAVTPPPSKSMAHRLIIAAALADGVSTLENIVPSQDIEATLRCMTVLGARWEAPKPGTIRVHGIGRGHTFVDLPRFDCGESGSTLRFLIPIALAVAGGGVFTGHGRLMERPQGPYADLFREQGISWEQRDGVLTVQGRLSPGEYLLPGNVSSQFFTGLLFALPLLDAPSAVLSSTEIESREYSTMTMEAMRQAGISVAEKPGLRGFEVLPAAYCPFAGAVEADWSQAAFWYAANFLGSPVEIQGLNPLSAQGDLAVASLYWRLARPGDREIDVSGCPDLLPPLAVMAAVRQGTVRFVHAARLRLKESDRLQTTAAMLQALGGTVEEGADSLTVQGQPQLLGGTVDGANDHRIVMAAAVAATACAGSVTVLGAEAVHKSYPDFFTVYQALGGAFHVL